MAEYTAIFQFLGKEHRHEDEEVDRDPNLIKFAYKCPVCRGFLATPHLAIDHVIMFHRIGMKDIARLKLTIREFRIENCISQ